MQILTHASTNEREAVRILDDAAQRRAKHHYSEPRWHLTTGGFRALQLMDTKLIRPCVRWHMQTRSNPERSMQSGASLSEGQFHSRLPAIIFVSEKHGIQVWYKHEGACGTCQRYTKSIEVIWDYATELGLKRSKRLRIRHKWQRNYLQR